MSSTIRTDAVTLGYAGTLGHVAAGRRGSRAKNWLWSFSVDNIDQSTRSLRPLIDGLAVLRERRPDAASRVRVKLWGNIDASNLGYATALGFEDQVLIEPSCSQEESLRRQGECDALLLPLESSTGRVPPLFIPGKLYEYLERRKPMLVLAQPSETRSIAESSGLAIAADPNDSRAVASALLELVEASSDLDRNLQANEAEIRRYSADQMAAAFAQLFDEALGRAAPVSSPTEGAS